MQEVIVFKAEDVFYLSGKGLVFCGPDPTDGKSTKQMLAILLHNKVSINEKHYEVLAVEYFSHMDGRHGKNIGLVVRSKEIKSHDDFIKAKSTLL